MKFLMYAGLIFPLVLAACSGALTQEEVPGPDSVASPENEYRIVTLLPRDAIPAIDNPEFHTGLEADQEYASDELVIGVEFEGDARAYSVSLLSGHEIVNDTVGGRKIAVTW